MTRGYFVTGTDTGVGKTLASLAVMHGLQRQGHVVTGMKPIASGCWKSAQGWVNDDALLLQAQASYRVPYDLVNPYAFEPPVAPHLAAREAGVSIELEVITQALKGLTASADRVVVEGVGGWLVPIDDRRTTADVAAALGLPVIMVVGIRLGCLNHALLTAQAIAAASIPFAGWIANRVDPACERQDALIEDLRHRLPVPCLGELAHCAEREEGVAQGATLNLR